MQDGCQILYQQGNRKDISEVIFVDEYRSSRESLSAILHHMLNNQHAYNDMLERRLFKVVSGNGIGQRASRQLLIFLLLAETHKKGRRPRGSFKPRHQLVCKVP